MREAFERCSLFAGVPQSQVDELVTVCRTRRYAADDLVCAEGELPQCVWIVATGALAYVSRSRDGHESIVGVVGRGIVVGLACLADGQGMHSEVRAHRASIVVEIPCKDLLGFAACNPMIWRSIAVLAFRRMRILVEVRRAQDQSSLMSRITWQLLSHLPHLAQADPKTGAPRLPVSQEDIAKVVGASRSRVNRVLQALQSRGLVRLSYRGISILEPARLAELVDSRVLALDDSTAVQE